MLRLLLLIAFYNGFVTSTTILSTNISYSGNGNDVTSNSSLNNTQINDDTVLDYFYGNNSNTEDENQSDNLDLSVIDMDSVKKFLKAAENSSNSFYNQTEVDKALRERKRSNEAFFYVPFFIKKAMDLMKQSLYSTRYRLQDTRELRKRYADDSCYNLAIFYGALMQLRMKMDNAYATISKLLTKKYDVKFIWFLGLYERCLALSVDVTYMVEAMFKLKDTNKDFVFDESVEKPQN